MKEKQTHWCREESVGRQKGGAGGTGEGRGGSEKHKSSVTEQPWGCKYGMGSTVNTTTVSVCGPGGYWKSQGQGFVKYRSVYPARCASETKTE